MQEAFRKLLAEAIGEHRVEQALSGLASEASVSLRLNPFKHTDAFPLGGDGECRPVAWSEHGRLLSGRPVFTLDPLFHAGAYYVQDSSAMYVGELFRNLLSRLERPQDRPLRVLDLCAAPGGKTTDAAASLRAVCGDSYLLLANEIMRSRAGVLADNVAIWGDPCVAVSSLDPAAFAALPEFFDIIIADVPCSGEGMFRKDSRAREQWSVDNVALCAQRQRRIVADVWPALRPGGLFIYSTCTFNRQENDGNVEWIRDNLGAGVLDLPLGYEGLIATEYGCSLVPGFVPGEGQYCAALRKEGEPSLRGARTPGRARPVRTADRRSADCVGSLFGIPVSVRTKGDLLTALPACIGAELQEFETVLPLLSAGCAAGRIKGRDFVPDADLALCTALREDAFTRLEVDRELALAFLHRDNIVLGDAEPGLILLCYQNVPLGFVKNLGRRCNSLLPQSRRIRMDIE